MITKYHRPKTLTKALILTARPDTRPLGGGTVLNQPAPESFAVVDLQALGLDAIEKKGNALHIGAAATLQALLENPHTPAALKTALKREAPLNVRNAATAAGALVASDGRAPFAAVMLALDAEVTVISEQSSVSSKVGDILPLRAEKLAGKLITQIAIPLNVKAAYEYVARTPADRPIVCAAAAQWPSGRTRLVVGGWGDSPSLAMDGPDESGIQAAARSACHEADDEWGSAEYRQDAAATLARRCLAGLTA